MAKRKMDIFTLDQKSRSRYTYFVSGDAEAGYQWHLFAGDDSLCMSDVFATKSDCLKTLRAVQRHAATDDVRDDAD
jgi:hypothetical protein